MSIEVFMENFCNASIKTTPLSRVKIFAKELMLGVINDLWDFFIEFQRSYQGKNEKLVHNREGFLSRDFNNYLYKRWQNEYPRLELVAMSGYITLELDGSGFQITDKCLELLSEVEPTNIFISYKRSESSAFAMLVLSSLKQAGLEPFLDLDLIPGEDWHAGLQERVQKYDYLIALLGKESLKSEYVIKEIAWALEANLQVIPICHNGFKYNAAEWQDLRADVREFLGRTHYIPVEVESAAGYHQALTLLLNRFGITP